MRAAYNIMGLVQIILYEIILYEIILYEIILYEMDLMTYKYYIII